MSCTPTAFPIHALAEATRISPNRRKTSDGICGDARHAREASDHNPDGRGIPHAFDVSQDNVNFNAHRYGDLIAHRMALGLERRVKYLVSWDYATQRDKIFNMSIGPYWRLMDTRDHLSHLHTSFIYAPWAENSTDPFFGGSIPPPTTASQETDMPSVLYPLKASEAGKEKVAVLDAPRKKVLLFNGAGLQHDVPAGSHREWTIPSPSAVLSMCESGTRDSSTNRIVPDGKGVVITNAAGQTYRPFWS